MENIQEIIEELSRGLSSENLIKDNKLFFIHKEKMYRLRMPNQRELFIANEKEKQYRIKLSKQEDTITKKNLIKLLKEKQDVDIEAMQLELFKLEDKELDLNIILSGKSDDDLDSIGRLKIKIKEVQEERAAIIHEMSDHLSPAIQVQSEEYYIKILTSECTYHFIEVNKKEDWKKNWDNYEEFEKDDTKLPLIAIGYMTSLLINSRD